MLLSQYESLNSVENRVKYLALRCFLLTGDISLVRAFYARLVIIITDEFKVA